MAVRKIITPPDPLLKKPSLLVKEVDDSIRELVRDMFDTMYAAPGIGLAAVQIGVPLSVIVMDTAREEEEPRPLALINPQIVWASEETRAQEEGCLSVPDIYDEVERPAEVRVRYLDLDGKEQEKHFTGLDATCVQHEIDHTKGILFIDHLGRLKRERYLKKVIKKARQMQEA
ncbi:peptide deformylase [Thermopetrobacter sp. TC1]|uniref:peptide deformylase n=1 Tax=Thermopetrobacter sp. TC1 TaxID=1495045 RepID=UPI000571DB92|nr:peptide deformylase [Thermopetrobacter sp. TC1]